MEAGLCHDCDAFETLSFLHVIASCVLLRRWPEQLSQRVIWLPVMLDAGRS